MPHTPGRWTVRSSDVSLGFYGVREAEERLTTLFNTELESDTADDVDLRQQAVDEEDTANARLIAEAPEMLAILKGHLEWHDGDDPECGLCSDVRALLLRIEGNDGHAS